MRSTRPRWSCSSIASTAAENGEVFFEVTMHDAWVWDMYRPARFVKNVRVVTFKDVNIEELAKSDLQLPEES